MTNIIRKIFVIFVILLILSSIVSINSFADITSSNPFDFKAFESGAPSVGIEDNVTDIFGTALNIVRIVALGIAVIMLSVLGIKYMSAAPGDKAEIKKHLVIFTIGIIVVVTATSVFEIIAKFANSKIVVS